jgi:tetratricopeptide (TPR) repeat protein
MPNKNIYSELQQGNLVDALVMLQTKVSSLGDWQLLQDLEWVRDTYSTMLSYLAKGIEDPKAQSIRTDLIQQAYAINDRANRAITLKKSPFNKYCQAFTQSKAEALDIATTQIALETVGEEIKHLLANTNQRERIREHDLEAAVRQHDTLIEKLFNHIWTSGIWTKSENTLYTQLMGSEQLPADDKAIIISALTLACYELFDAQKLMLLFDSYLQNDIEVSQRSLVGLILLIIRYDSRLSYYPQIKSRFALYCENRQFVEDCFRVLMQLQYSKMTDSVSAKMTQDIMPAILRSSRFQGIDLRNLDKELTKNGENPEWHQNTKDDKNVEKKLKQMTDMQTEGADVYWSSFVSLKGFSFFQKLHHWVAPFSFEYPESYQFTQSMRPEILQTVKSLFQFAPFCSSDKYSFIFMIDSVKQAGQDMIANQINSQLNEEGGGDLFEQVKPHTKKPKEVSRCYIFDLYRVFKAYPYHSELFDPFGKQLVNFSPLYFDTLKPLADNYDDLLGLAEFMMRRGAYHDASTIFFKLNPQEREEDSDLWQKIGFCSQKQGNPALAIPAYRMAYKLNPKSKWTVQHLAQTAFELKEFSEAQQYFDLLLEDDEDNLKWLYKKAECLFGQEKYEDCLPTLYKLAYLDEHSEHAQEMLAWGLLMTGNDEKAEKIHVELMEQNPSVRNNINLAHLYLRKGEIPNAYNLYAAAYQLAKSEEEFTKAFWEWRPYLQHIGLNAKRLELMLDAVRMNNN